MKLVAKFRVSIGDAIPHIINLLSDRKTDSRRAGAETLAKLSVQGEITHVPV